MPVAGVGRRLAPPDQPHLGTRLRQRDAGLEPCEDGQRAPVAGVEKAAGGREGRLHRERNPHVVREADNAAAEARRHHTDDRHLVAVDQHLATHDAAVAGEPPMPQGGADDRDRRTAGGPILVRVECPAQ
jgi:hypothetical protein